MALPADRRAPVKALDQKTAFFHIDYNRTDIGRLNLVGEEKKPPLAAGDLPRENISGAICKQDY